MQRERERKYSIFEPMLKVPEMASHATQAVLGTARNRKNVG
jgi:hypothetical protein